MKKAKIVFTGGGTAGHLFPLIAIARELGRLPFDKQLVLHYIGPTDSLGLILLGQENFTAHPILLGKLRRYFSFENITDILFNIPLGFLQSFFYLLWIRPRLVFSKGGSGSLVVVSAAMVLGIPIFLHESDIAAGLSNKIAAKWAKKIFISYSKTQGFGQERPKQQILMTGNPIERELLEGNKDIAKELFSLTFEKPILLFMGGSQGAQAINDFVLDMLNILLQNYEVIHVCGKKNYAQVKAESMVVITEDLEKYYHVEEFLDEIKLKHAFKAADFVVSRSGSAIFEIATCGKPSILIPLPTSANNHQSMNAYAYAKTGAAIVMEQENLDTNLFLSKVNSLFENPDELEKMKQSALAFAKPFAAQEIAAQILEFVK